MADLAASAVTVDEVYESEGLNGKRHIVKELTLTLTGQGSTTNKITADVLGFDKIIDSSHAITDDNTVICAVRSYDGSYLILGDSDGSAGQSPVDITNVIRVRVTGTKDY